jgi:hypothetical protein
MLVRPRVSSQEQRAVTNPFMQAAANLAPASTDEYAGPFPESGLDSPRMRAALEDRKRVHWSPKLTSTQKAVFPPSRMVLSILKKGELASGG